MRHHQVDFHHERQDKTKASQVHGRRAPCKQESTAFDNLVKSAESKKNKVLEGSNLFPIAVKIKTLCRPTNSRDSRVAFKFQKMDITYWNQYFPKCKTLGTVTFV